MSEYTGQTDPLRAYFDQVRQLHGFTDAANGDPNALQRYQGAIWPANNPVGTEYTQGMAAPSGPFVPAPSGRIDTAEHIMSLPGADLATGFVLGVDAGGNPLRVYHGTPHTFPPVEGNPLGAFDPARIGSGEGAQAYGHGLYVAESEDVARGYRDRLSGASIVPGAADAVHGYSVNGSYPPTGIAGHAALDTANDIDGLLSYMHMHENKPSLSPWWKPGDEIKPDFDARPSYQRSMDYLKGQIEGRIQRFRDNLGGQPPNGMAERDMSALADWYDQNLRNAKPGDVEKRPPGRMYEAEFHASPDELLDWDKPLSQQSPKVQKVLEGLGIKAPEIGTRQLDNGKWVVDYTDEAGKPKTSSRQFPDQATAQLYGGETMKMMGRDPTGEKIYRDMLPRVTYSVREGPEGRWGPSGVDTYDQALATVGGDKSRVLTVNRQDDAHASQRLQDAGLKGIRYLDAGSRAAGDWTITPPTQTTAGDWMVKSSDYNSKGLHFATEAEARAALAEKQGQQTRNHVVFNPSSLNIIRRYGIAGLVGGGAAAGAAQQQ